MSKSTQFIKVLSSFPPSIGRRRRKPPPALRKIVVANQMAQRFILYATRDNYSYLFKSETAFCLECQRAYSSDYILESHLYNDYTDPEYDSVNCPICDEKSLITPYHISPSQPRLLSTLTYSWHKRLLSLYQH